MIPKSLKWTLVILAGFAAPIAALFIYVNFANESANRSAVILCREIQVGDNVSVVVAKAKAFGRKALGPNKNAEYLILFPGFGMDKALCTVQTEDEIVRSKSAEMFYD